jgi:predicted lipoprotein with Yx(FWY)xxD motif
MTTQIIRRFLAVMAVPLMLVIACAAAAADEPEPQAPGTAVVVSASTASVEAPRKGFVEWAWKELTDEASLTIGYGVMKWVLDIKRTSDSASGTLVQRDDSTLFISYSTKPYFFKDSNFGYTVMVNYSDFDLTKQETANDKYADYGTEVHGYIVYAVPTLYYQWGEHLQKERFVRIGIGAGVGAARFSGTVRLSTGEIIHTSQHDLEPRLALSNFLIARWNHVGVQFSFASPRVYGDGYDAKVRNASLYATYTFNF